MDRVRHLYGCEGLWEQALRKCSPPEVLYRVRNPRYTVQVLHRTLAKAEEALDKVPVPENDRSQVRLLGTCT